MLSAEDNEILTRVGPGTPMGNLLRRYWIPACLSSEIGQPDGPPARVRLLGEDLVAFRDTGGSVGPIYVHTIPPDSRTGYDVVLIRCANDRISDRWSVHCPVTSNFQPW